MLLLHQVEFAHDVVGALLEARITGGRVHQRDRREMVTGDVSREVAPAAVPPAVGLALGGEPSAHAIEVQHAIGIEREEISGVELLCMLERAAGQANLLQRDRARPHEAALRRMRIVGSRNGGRDRFGGGCSATDHGAERQRGGGGRRGAEEIATGGVHGGTSKGDGSRASLRTIPLRARRGKDAASPPARSPPASQTPRSSPPPGTPAP